MKIVIFTEVIPAFSMQPQRIFRMLWDSLFILIKNSSLHIMWLDTDMQKFWFMSISSANNTSKDAQ